MATRNRPPDMSPRVSSARHRRAPARRRYGAVAATVLGAVALWSCGDDGVEPCVLGIDVNPPSVTMISGESVILSAAISRSGGCDGASTNWSSSNPSVVEVSATGRLTAASPGSASVTATVSDGSTSVSESVPVTVMRAPVAAVEVTPASTTIEVGQTASFTAVVRDGSGNVLTDRSVIWSSGSESIATVTSSGTVTGAGTGTATITATSEGVSGTASVTVTEATVGTVEVNPAATTIEVGQSTSLAVVVRDGSGNVLTDRTVVWSSGSEGVATVTSNGTVTGVGAGTATITATSEGVSGTASVTVTEATVDRVEVTPATVQVAVGSTQTLQARAFDSRGVELAGRAIAWSTGNADVATVDGGVVTGVAEGTATITARSGGASGTATVTVVRDAPELIHRWSFSENGGSGSTLVDAEGGAHGTIREGGGNDGTVGGGQVTLAGGGRDDTDYVDLPDGLLSGLTDATIEIWAMPLGARNWSRIFDFGAGTGNYLMMSWSIGTNTDVGLLEWRGNGQNFRMEDDNMRWVPGRPYHIVLTVDEDGGPGDRTRLTLYRNGNLVGTLDTELDLADLTDDDNFLGRSQFPADATAYASWNELRIYDGALSPGEIAASFDAGPDMVDGTISVAPDNLRFGYIGQQVRLLPLRLDASGNAFPADFTFSTSNPGVAIVSSAGLVTAQGTGSATINIGSQGAAASVPLTVTEAFVEVATFGGHTYGLIPEGLTWTQAWDRARAFGARLVVIDSPAENDFLADRYQRRPDGSLVNLWIGMTMVNGVPTWRNDAPLSFAGFPPGEPSGDGPCVHLWGTGPGVWNDIDCGNAFQAVVELDFVGPLEFLESFRHDGGHYVLTTPSMDWLIARDMARIMGGRLVVIETPAENEAVFRLAYVGQWLGLRDRGAEGQFRWVDGTLPTYTNWAVGEPNGGLGSNCAQFAFEAGAQPGQWADRGCWRQHRAVFEFR